MLVRCHHMPLSENSWGYDQPPHDATEAQNSVNQEGPNSLYEAEKSDIIEILQYYLYIYCAQSQRILPWVDDNYKATAKKASYCRLT